MATPTDISKPYRFLNGGPLDWWWGPYANVAAALAAIPNTVDAFGINFREGKKVAIIEGGAKVEYYWRNSYLDAGLVPVVAVADGRTFKGLYNTVTNTPALANGTGTIGDYYQVDVAGTRNYGAGNVTTVQGGIIIYNGSTWEASSSVDNYATVAYVDERFLALESGVQNLRPDDDLPTGVNVFNLKLSGVYSQLTPTGGDPIEVEETDYENGYPIAWKDVDGFWHKSIVENPILDDYVNKNSITRIEGKNKYDPATGTNQYINTANGAPVNSANARLSDFIKVSPSSKFTISGRTSDSGVAYYDINKVLIPTPPVGGNWSAGPQNGTYTAGPTTEWIRVTTKFNNIGNPNTVQIEIGETATSFEAYQLFATTVDSISLAASRLITDIGLYSILDYLTLKGLTPAALTAIRASIAETDAKITYNQDNSNYSLKAISGSDWYVPAAINQIIPETNAYLLGLGIVNSYYLANGVYLTGTTRRDLFYKKKYGYVIDGLYAQVVFYIKTDDPAKFQLGTVFVSTGSGQQGVTATVVTTLIEPGLYEVRKSFRVPTSGGYNEVWIGSSFSQGGTAPTDELTVSGFFVSLSPTNLAGTVTTTTNTPKVYRRINEVEYNAKVDSQTNAAAIAALPPIPVYRHPKLYQKKSGGLGDSITQQGGSGNYGLVVANRYGMTWTNYGIAGTKLAGPANASGQSMWERLAAMSNDLDFIWIFGGTNDISASVPIGTNADTDPSLTFKGALNFIAKAAIEKWPLGKIFFITPFNHRAGIKAYCDAIMEIGSMWSIPVLDLYSKAGYLPLNDVQRNAMGANPTDYQHLNTAGYKNLADKVEAFMLSL